MHQHKKTDTHADPMFFFCQPHIFKTIADPKLPFINLCIWDSRWFNEFMVHQLFKYYIVVEAEKDTTDSVFNVIIDFNKNVFLKPYAEIFRRYIINHQKVIIVKPLISESPLQEQQRVYNTGVLRFCN